MRDTFYSIAPVQQRNSSPDNVAARSSVSSPRVQASGPHIPAPRHSAQSLRCQLRFSLQSPAPLGSSRCPLVPPRPRPHVAPGSGPHYPAVADLPPAPATERRAAGSWPMSALSAPSGAGPPGQREPGPPMEGLGPAPGNRPRPPTRLGCGAGGGAELVLLCCGSARPAVPGSRPAPPARQPARHGARPRRPRSSRPRCHPRGLVPRDVQPVARPGPVSSGGAAATSSTLAVPGYPRLPQVLSPAWPRAPEPPRWLSAQTAGLWLPVSTQPAETPALVSAQPAPLPVGPLSCALYLRMPPAVSAQLLPPQDCQNFSTTRPGSPLGPLPTPYPDSLGWGPAFRAVLFGEEGVGVCAHPTRRAPRVSPGHVRAGTPSPAST